MIRRAPATLLFRSICIRSFGAREMPAARAAAEGNTRMYLAQVLSITTRRRGKCRSIATCSVALMQIQIAADANTNRRAGNRHV
jgi:hypothetical protein